MYTWEDINKVDPVIAELIQKEFERQNSHIELIASENWTSPAVTSALGTCLTNKYAEGYPGRRYYGGCEVVDQIESIAIERAKKLFGCTYANVQPHSGAQANFAVFYALLQPGDTFMGMSLDEGGHLTHGSPANVSGNYFNAVPYGVDENGFIDYDACERIAKECRPKLIVAGASAHPSPIPYADVTTTTTHKTLRGPRGGMILSSEEFAKAHFLNKGIFPGTQGGPQMHSIAAKAVMLWEDLQPEYVDYARRVVENAQALAGGLMKRGVRIVSGGTDNHLMLVDLKDTELTGKELEKRLDNAHITANKNTVPRDPRSPFITSGIRLGTPAATTRGLNTEDMDRIAEAIAMVIESEDNIPAARETVRELTEKYPLE